MRKLLVLIFFTTSIFSCKNDTKITDQHHDTGEAFTDTIMLIHTKKDLKHDEWIIKTLGNQNEEHKINALIALGSVKKPSCYQPILDLLKSETPNESMIEAASFALGNCTPPDSINSLINWIKASKTSAQSPMMVTLGKIDATEGIEYLLHQEVTPQTTEGLYRGVLNGKGNIQVIEKAIDALNSKDKNVRFWAAHTLQRQRDHDLTSWADALKDHLHAEDDLDTKIALAGAFRHIVGQGKNGFLSDQITVTNSPLVIVNLLRSMGETNFASVLPQVVALLNDPNQQVAMTAAQTLGRKYNEAHRSNINSALPQIKDPMLCNELFYILAKNDPKDEALEKMVDAKLGQTTDVYEKKSLIKAKSQFENALEWLIASYDSTQSELLKGHIQQYILEQELSRDQQREWIVKSLNTTDDAHLCQVLSYMRSMDKGDIKPEWTELVKTVEYKLELPAQTEVLVEMNHTLAYIFGEEPPTYRPPYNNKLDWEYLMQLPPTPKVKVTTNKGDITWELYPQKVPGAVASILKLVDAGYYDGKSFHRVIPNFVAQGGCPRGDGWGGVDYSTRSEYHPDLRYKTGAIGLASIGEDTESCQFFMCHSPTPHLDDRYTVFGYVIDGLDILNQLGVGDKIVKIERLDSGV